MNKKILISVIVIAVVIIGIAAFFILQESSLSNSIQESSLSNSNKTRDSFFEIHMEPSNANDDMFSTLNEFVNLADQHSVKLTLLFTPSWAEMILADESKTNLINQWKQKGHEIGGHHHCPSTCPWDGYTNLEYKSQEFEEKQSKVPCPDFVRESEKYLGNMNDYMELLGRLGEIKTITMCDENVDWPNGALYAAGGRRLEGAISEPKIVIFNGYKVYKLTSAPLEPKASIVTGMSISIDELKNEYLSDREGVFGIGVHGVSYKANPNLYKQWFEFLNKQDPEMNHSKTISQIIEEEK